MVVGSVAPAGSPFSSVFSATVDSALDGAPVDARSNVGLNPKANRLRIGKDQSRGHREEGRAAASAVPMAPNRADFGSRRHAFEGQKTRVPIRETIAGTRVRRRRPSP